MTTSAPVVSGSDTPAEGNYAKATAWRGEGRNNTYSEPTLTVSAICADPSK